MNTADFLTSGVASSLGWTLLHSLWQVALLLLLVAFVLKFVTNASTRYVIACSALVMSGLAAVITFSLYESPETSTHSEISGRIATASYTIQNVEPTDGEVIGQLNRAVAQATPWMIAAWMAGVLFFSLRYAGGFFYAQRLRASAIAPENDWSGYLTRACRTLGIQRAVSLAASPRITTPMVIGYIKPVILIPVGMFTGLSSEQVETILLHELAHIRRHDYLVNYFQAAMETLLFFNPFIWILSDLIRREREYCCDDLVIEHHGSTRAYALALAHLEERRLSSHAFALGLANNRNQLLNRIRRIMENSTKQHVPRNRFMVSGLIIIAGLLCVSWLGIQQTTDENKFGPVGLSQDTAIHKKKGMASWSRRTIITLDENGQPHEEVIEEFEGDEALRPFMNQENVVPPVTGSLLPPPFPGAPQTFNPFADTIPPPVGFPGHPQWDEFASEFETRFRMHFDDLFSGEGNPFEMLESFQERFHHKDFGWDSTFQFHFPPEMFDQESMRFDSLGEHALEQLRHLQPDQFPQPGKLFGPNQWNFFPDEKAIGEALIEDGYLSEGERIQSMEWNEQEFKVNGKVIEKADAKKYRELMNQHSSRTGD